MTLCEGGGHINATFLSSLLSYLLLLYESPRIETLLPTAFHYKLEIQKQERHFHRRETSLNKLVAENLWV